MSFLVVFNGQNHGGLSVHFPSCFCSLHLCIMQYTYIHTYSPPNGNSIVIYRDAVHVAFLLKDVWQKVVLQPGTCLFSNKTYLIYTNFSVRFYWFFLSNLQTYIPQAYVHKFSFYNIITHVSCQQKHQQQRAKLHKSKIVVFCRMQILMSYSKCSSVTTSLL